MLKIQPVSQAAGARSRSMARGAEVLISTRSLAVLNLEDDDLAHPDRIGLVVEEQDVAALKRRLHAAAKYDYYGRLALRQEHQSFPDHQGRKDDHREVEALVQQ